MTDASIPELDEPALLTRRRVLLGLASASAAAATSSALVAATASPAAASAVTGLVTGPGNGAANHAALQAAFDGASLGDTLELPGGTFEIDLTGGPVWITRSVTLVGSLGATPTVFDLVPNDHIVADHAFLKVLDRTRGTDEAVMSGNFRFTDFTINGPTQAYLTQGAGNASEGTPEVYGIGWGVRGSVGELSVERVTITGALIGGILRSGMGLTRVIDCDICAYATPVAIFDDTNTPHAGGALIRGGAHKTGTSVGWTTKYSSVGLYIHACASLLLSDVTYQNLQRYGVYANGEPDSVPDSWVVENVTIDSCGASVQTATKTNALFVGLKVINQLPGPGGTLKGSTTFVNCSFIGAAEFGYANNDPDSLMEFVGCWIQPTGFFVAAGNGFGGGTDGTLRFSGCTVAMPPGSFLSLSTAGWKGTLELLDCDIYDCGSTTPWYVHAEGGSIFIDNTSVHTSLTDPIVWVASPPNTLTGAATVGPPVTCPSPPA